MTDVLEKLRQDLASGRAKLTPATTTRIAVIPDFLRALAGSLGSIVGDRVHAEKGAAIVNALTKGASLIEKGEAGVAALAAIATQLKALTAGPEASGAEWATFKTQTDAAHAVLASGPAPRPGVAPSAGSLPST
jgi:hypothetical protein